MANGQRADISTTLGSGCKAFRGKIFCPAATPVFASDPGGPKFGNSGRNIFYGNHQTYVNGSLFKNLHVTESFTVQLRAQALGEISPLTPGEAELAGAYCLRARPMGRAWEYWTRRLGKAGELPASAETASGRDAHS